MGLLLPCRVAGARGWCGYTQLGTSQRGPKRASIQALSPSSAGQARPRDERWRSWGEETEDVELPWEGSEARWKG